jgi:hypothetical protein
VQVFRQTLQGFRRNSNAFPATLQGLAPTVQDFSPSRPEKTFARIELEKNSLSPTFSF